MRNPDKWKKCKKLDSDKIELYTLDNFLTDEECDKIIEITKRNLIDSTVGVGGKEFDSKGCIHITQEMIEKNHLGGLVAPADGTFTPEGTNYKIEVKRGSWAKEPGVFCLPDNDFPVFKTPARTSKSSPIEMLTGNDRKYMESIDDKMCEFMNIDKKCAEGIQTHYYSVGKEFTEHNDYWYPNTREMNTFGKIQGNRTWTFMVYLNDVEEGGATYFRPVDARFYPKKGKAIFWDNLLENGEPNEYTMHSGEPPLKGEKFLLGKWFRERPYDYKP